MTTSKIATKLNSKTSIRNSAKNVSKNISQNTSKLSPAPSAQPEQISAGQTQAIKIMQTLRESGRRQTKLKKAILQCMSEEKRPMTVIQILDWLKRKNINPNKSSIYRFLQAMQEEKLLRIEALNPSEAHFELAIGQTHNHFTCLQCSTVLCLDEMPSVKNISSQVSDMYGVSVENEKINITGTCATCIAKNKATAIAGGVVEEQRVGSLVTRR